MTTLAYLRDPGAIYALSFATIEAEADLDRFDADERVVATRMIHACGMVDLANDILIAPGAVGSALDGLRSGGQVYCDANMVREGLIASKLPADCEPACDINAVETRARAEREGTTRSAAQVDGWRIEGSIIVVGNAPTALFRLMERCTEYTVRPAVVIGVPVGFVGAVESKEALILTDLPYITVRGRRGGSAIAAAALNAIAGLGDFQ